MRAITEEPKTDGTLTLSAVEEDQPFVDSFGRLCLKMGYGTYVIIAKSDGTPWVDKEDDDETSEETEITKILPKIKRWEF